MSKGKYEAVPDAEAPDDITLPSSDVLIAKAQEKYPEAGTEIEAEFLGRLDDAIDNAQPKIEIPRISPDQLQPSTEIDDTAALFDAMKLPTMALVAMIATALLLALANSPFANAIYPYFACVTTFMASVPDIRKRFMAAVVPVFDKFDTMKKSIEGRVEGVSAKAFKYLNVTETSMNQAIAPIKNKVAFATKMETALRQVDPTIDIPGKYMRLGLSSSSKVRHLLYVSSQFYTSDIEKEFNGFEDELTQGFTGMQQAVDFSRRLPAPLQSLQKYELYVMIPFLATMLALQVYGVYSTSQQDDAVVDAMGNGRLLVETNVTEAPTMTSTLAPTMNNDVTGGQWLEIWVAVQCYVSTVVQVVLAFL
ncbi:MAG: hypothetical protein SGARI_002974, partial [Bacillariaceae sp.]